MASISLHHELIFSLKEKTFAFITIIPENRTVV
jgi:hypothetical protein